MEFSESGEVIVGLERFYRIDWSSWCLEEFLDKRGDPSLAFAAFGAAHYDSFPIAVLPVNPPGEPTEYLLCYNGRLYIQFAAKCFQCFFANNKVIIRSTALKFCGVTGNMIT